MFKPLPIFLEHVQKRFEVIENVKKWELEGDWAKLGPKIGLLRQSQTKYLKQNGEIQ